MDTVIHLISSVGFPIVAYILLFNRMKEHDELFNETLAGFRTAIENNTAALNEIKFKIGGDN